MIVIVLDINDHILNLTPFKMFHTVWFFMEKKHIDNLHMIFRFLSNHNLKEAYSQDIKEFFILERVFFCVKHSSYCWTKQYSQQKERYDNKKLSTKMQNKIYKQHIHKHIYA